MTPEKEELKKELSQKLSNYGANGSSLTLEDEQEMKKTLKALEDLESED